jgi:hypothetical protein
MLSGSTPTGGTGTYTYQWESSANQSSWASITGATARDYTPGVLNANTYFRRIVTSGTCPGSTSTAVSVQVGSVSIIPSATTICAGQSITLTGNTTLNSTNQSPCTLSGLPSTLQNGLVGYWPFCGNANDVSGNGNHGTVNGPVLTTDRFGNVNSAYSFDGVDDLISLPSAGMNQRINNQPRLTMVAWVNLSNLTQNGAVFNHWKHWPVNGPVGIQFGYQISSRLFIGTNHSFGAPTVPTSILANQWEMITCIYDGNQTNPSDRIKFYIGNNIFVPLDCAFTGANCNFTTAIGNQSDETFIGAASSMTALAYNYFNGKIDDIGIWNRNLSQSEIQQLYSLSNIPQPQYTWSTGAPTSTISASPSTTTTYSLQVTSGNQTCSAQQVINVESPPTPNTLSGNQTICSNSIPAMITGSTPTGGTGTYAYQWESSANQSTWASTIGATARDYTPSLLNANTYFRRIVTSGNCPGSTSTAVSVQLGSVSIIPSATTICAGQSITLTGNTTLNTTTQSPCTLSGLPSTLQNGLVGYWPFCGNANDVSGNGNHGTVNGATLTNDRLGNTNSSYSFNGINNYINIGSNSLFTNQYAYSSWVYLDSAILQARAVIISKLQSTGIYQYKGSELNINNQQHFLTIQGNDTLYNYFESTANIVPLNQWSQIVATYDGLHIKHYVNGNFIDSATAFHLADSLGSPIFFGARPFDTNGPYWFMNGLLDDIGIWNRALSSQEIQQLYTLGQTQYAWSTGATTSTITASPSTTTTYSLQVTNGNQTCSAQQVITVQTPPTPNTLSGNQTICSNSIPAMLTGTSPTGGTGTYAYQWESSANQSAWASISGATARDYTPSLLNANTYFRRILTSGVCAPSTSVSVAVQVDGMPMNNVVTGSQTLCAGTAAQMLTGSLPSGGVGGFTYQWESSFNNSVWSAVPASTTQNHNPGVVVQSAYFRRVVFSGSCTPSTSAGIYVQADAAVLSGNISSAQTLCSGNSANTLSGTQPSGGTGIYAYQWESSSNNLTWQTLSAATQSTYAPGVVSQSGYYRRLVSSGVCVPGSSNAILIQVEFPSGNNIISSAQSICTGTQPLALSGTLPTGGSGLYQYQWQSSPDGSAWLSISGATAPGHQPPVLNQSVWYRRVLSSGVCAPHTSLALSIQVQALPGNNTIQSNQTLCAGNSALTLTGSLPSGGSGVYTYQWQSASDNISWVAIPSATTAAWNPGILNGDTYYRRVVTSGVCGPNNSSSVWVKVEQPITQNTIQSNQSICQGFPGAFLAGSVPSGGSGQYQYQWQSGTDGFNWFNITGGQSRGYDPGMVSGQVYFRRVVQSGLCAPATSAWVRIEAQPRISGNQITSAQTLCAGSLATALSGMPPTGGTGLYAYQWETSVNQFTWFPLAGQTQSQLSPGIVNATTFYRRLVSSGVCAASSSMPVSIVAEQAVGNNVVSPNQTLCAGATPGNLTGTLPTGGNGVYAYQWERSTDGITWQNITGATSTGYLPLNLTQSTYYRRTITSGLCGAFAGVPALIQVETRIGNNGISANQTLCIGGIPQSFVGSVPAGGNGQYAYQWQSAPNLLAWVSIPGATQQSYAHATLQNTTYFRRVVTAGLCPTNYSVTIGLYAIQGIGGNSISASQTLCNNTLPTLLTGTTPQGGNGVFTYLWESSSNGLLWLSIPGATQAQYQPGAVITRTYYRRLAQSGTCGGAASNVVSIEQDPAIANNTITGLTAVCSGTSPGILSGSLPTGGNGVFAYQWQSGSNTQNWVNIPGGTQMNYTVGLLNATVYFRRLVSSGGGACAPAVSGVHTVVVSPLIGSNYIQQNQNICAGNAPALLSGSNPVGGNGQYTYEWQSSPDQITWNSISGATMLDYTPGVLMSNMYFRRIVYSGGCWQVSLPVGIRVRPAPVLSQQPIDQVMHIGGTVQFTVVASGTGITYNWQSDTGNGFYSLVNGGQYSGANTAQLTVSSVGMNNNNQRFRCLLTTGDCKTASTDASIRIAVGVEETAESIQDAVLYPNPGGAVFHIRLNEKTGVQSVELFDITGRSISVTWEAEAGGIIVNTGEISAGVYQVKVRTKEAVGYWNWVKE